MSIVIRIFGIKLGRDLMSYNSLLQNKKTAPHVDESFFV